MTDAPALRPWRYTAVGADGRRVRDVVDAADAGAAARTLAARGLTPLSLDEAAAAGVGGGGARGLRFGERVSVLRQLALMLEAGVDLLEAVRTAAEGVEAPRGRRELETVASALTRGSPLAEALEQHAPGFPLYVYAMTRVGERTARTGEVLREAAAQMAYEDRLRRDVLNALTYPAFLLAAGFTAVMFIFTQVVPRFAAMIGERRTTMPFASRAVLEIGLWANGHLPWVFAGVAALGLGGLAAAADAGVRGGLYALARRAPLIGPVLRAREVVGWARLTAFALVNGVQLLDAAALSRTATPPGPFRDGLERFEQDLRTGLAVDAALARHTALTRMDLSLLRAGEKAGALPRMLGFLAEGYDARLRDTLKRATALIEPLAIGAIAILVGAVALSLVLALSSVYETIG